MPRLLVCLAVLFAATTLCADEKADVKSLLEQRVIEADLPLREVREFTAGRIPPVPDCKTVAEWEQHAERIRRDTLDKVVFRGEAAKWRDAQTQVEWLETIDGGPGYRIKKLRFEALPGLWIPALLYEPEKLEGKVPVGLAVNGHDGKGKAAPYKQIRCINMAKRGMLALNLEWLGMGQLNGDNYAHYRMNQLDLCGTSGLAPFYLAMKRGLDVLLSLEHADPERVAVSGLSGGGWQTIILSSLDKRVTLANPVAGYSSLLTRTAEPSDLGDSEQTPVDFATTTDYSQLTALRAPHPTLLTYNSKDNCCFKADHALPPLLQAAGPIYKLYGKEQNLRSHINDDPGDHNYELDNRQAYYRMLSDFFFPGRSDITPNEIPSDNEVKTPEQLQIEIPANNEGFHTLALAVMKDLPRNAALPSQKEQALDWQKQARERLTDIAKYKKYDVQTVVESEKTSGDVKATTWRLRFDGTWTIPVVELERGKPTKTVILFSEKGRASLVTETEQALAAGHRVLALDPFYYGESKIEGRDFLFALLVSAVGDRPLGIQSSQVAAVARWAKKQHPSEPVTVQSAGPRSSLIALVAAGLEPEAINEVTLNGSYGSLKEVIEANMGVNETPELFTFGLLEHFDIKQLTALIAPRPVHFASASDRARKELADVSKWYGTLGSKFDPLK